MKFLKNFNESIEYNNREIDYEEYRNSDPLIPFNQDEYSKIIDFFYTTDIKFELKNKIEFVDGESDFIKFESKRFDINFYKMEDDWFILYIRHIVFEPLDSFYKCDTVEGCFEIINKVITPIDNTVQRFYEHSLSNTTDVLFKSISSDDFDDIVEDYDNNFVKFTSKSEIDKIVKIFTDSYISDDEILFKVEPHICDKEISFDIYSKNIIDENEDFDPNKYEFDLSKFDGIDVQGIFIYKMEDDYYLIHFDASGFHYRNYYYKADTIDGIQQSLDNVNEII